MSWPRNWRLQQDPQHGTVAFTDPSPSGALDHIFDPSSSVNDTVVFNTTLSAGGDEFYFEHTVEVSRPKGNLISPLVSPVRPLPSGAGPFESISAQCHVII